ncbi:MAG: hypothetical protein KC493_06010 [Bacteriovoracaceae bacterium]|nr:hypothetical protein [Bacteriovoracaceae bacterium]
MRLILLLCLLFSTTVQASDFLTLHIIRSPKGLDWSTPKSLARTVVGNALSPKNRMIGHVAVEINCEATKNEEAIHEFTGMSNQDSSVYSKQLLFKGIGFGVIFDTYAGRLENSSELKAEIEKKMNKKKKKNRYAFVKHFISSKTCRRLASYLSEYRSLGYGEYYGLPLDPLKREGAGCSAFGVSFLQVGGLMRKEFHENWSYNLNVPAGLIGGKFHPEDDIDKVSFFKLYFLKKSKNQWAKESEEHKKIFFWDPDTMYRWVMKRVQNMDYPAASISRTGESYGLIFQSSDVATPSGAFWKN